MVKLGNVADRYRFAALQRVSSRRDHHKAVPTIDSPLEIRFADMTGEDSDIGDAVPDSFNNPVTRIFPQIDADTGSLIDVDFQVFGKKLGDGGRICPKPNSS